MKQGGIRLERAFTATCLMCIAPRRHYKHGPRVQGRRSSKYRHEDLAKHTRRHIHTATPSTTFPGTHEVVLENAWGLVVDRIYWQIDDLDIDHLFALGS